MQDEIRIIRTNGGEEMKEIIGQRSLTLIYFIISATLTMFFIFEHGFGAGLTAGLLTILGTLIFIYMDIGFANSEGSE